MNINELDSYNLADAVKFHRRLNPRIWGRDEHLLPEVCEKLLTIAADFQEFLGVEDLNVKDITISGSNAAYSYTKNSDIDLHLVVEMPADPVYQELFNAKKYQYNDEHNIKIGGADVELYVQPADQTHHSLGIYSVKNGDWISVPQRKRARIDDACVRDKVSDLDARIHSAVQSKDLGRISTLWDKIKAMRQAGLEQHGEFGCENIAFKLLRNKGCIAALKDAKTALQDIELSLREANQPQQKFRYGFSEDMMDPTQQPYSSANGVAPTTKSFLEDKDSNNNIVNDFIQQVATELGIDPMPEIHLHTNPEWSEHNHSFGRYDPGSHTLNVSMPNRHILDVLRTVAHELVHCSQNQQQGGLPDDAGETGSRWENDANARAGIIMRDWANTHPEHFAQDSLEESASGYIPKNRREAAMPQYAMALSVDIKPGEVGKQANKLALKTGRNGEPGLLQPDAQNLLREFSEFVTEQENLFEITMSPSSLKKLSAQTGALAGMEFEMIVPNIEGNDDGDQEPDYDYDERCHSIEDAVQFFYDGDWNGRRDVERMRERMQSDFSDWLMDKVYQDWERHGEEYLEEWVPNNVDESEWNPEGLEGEARQEALEEYIAAMHADAGSSGDAFDEYREENQESYNESDWLDDEDLDRMSSIENAYSMNWPHWTTVGQGEGSIEEVADSFSEAIDRPVQASTSYHSSRVERPSVKSPHYIVEPDSSLDPDDNNDQGLEFVSPPLPIEELLSDLNKVKAWADRTGCYTNDSTGLHINVSVPGWSGDSNQLDYVKLALLLGDEHVLESFGRAGNTYCKSAMGKIQSIVKQNPNSAQELMDRMKSGMDQLASKVIHSRSTEKYTSINVKNGYIEFRSPGGDWLNDNFKEIDNTLRRFTVALSAAVDPEAYRQEYLKKLYKLLDVHSEKDPLSYFAKFAAGTGFSPTVLKSFIRQAQLERKVKRAPTDDATLPWRLRDTSTNEWATDSKGQGVYFDGTTRDDAMVRVKEYIQNRRNQGDTHNYWLERNPAVRPGQSSQGVDTRVDYELYDRTTNAVIDTFPARNDDEAQVRLNDYRSWPGASNPDNFGVRRAGRAPIAGSTLDLQRQRAAAAQIPTIDIDVEPAPAPQPAGMGQWNGQWKVLVGGQEVYRFGGIGNSQADANRIAAAWLRDNGQGVSGEGFEVYPVMNESLTESNQLQLKDFVVTISPHALSQAYNKGVDVDIVDDILRNISTVKDRIMSLEPGRALILHNGQGTGLGVRRQQGNRLTLATVFPTSPGFTKGKHPTFRVEANTVDEGVTSAMDAEQVLQYVKKTHGADKFNIEYSITDHPQWELKNIPLSQLNLDPDGEQQDPYNRTNWVDYDVVRDLMPKIAGVLEANPIVVDSDGWIIDGNHRAMAAAEAGLTSVPALVPAEVKEDVTESREEFEGITIEMIKNGHVLVVNALDDWGNKVLGHVKFNIGDGKELDPQDLRVDDKYQGQGIARVMYDYVKSLGYTINRSWDQTDAGAGFWNKHRGEDVRVWEQGVAENFADGKNPGRKGLSKRVGVNTKASVSSLRKTAKHSSGEKQRMAHWLANMKAGRAKNK